MHNSQVSSVLRFGNKERLPCRRARQASLLLLPALLFLSPGHAKTEKEASELSKRAFNEAKRRLNNAWVNELVPDYKVKEKPLFRIPGKPTKAEQKAFTKLTQRFLKEVKSGLKKIEGTRKKTVNKDSLIWGVDLSGPKGGGLPLDIFKGVRKAFQGYKDGQKNATLLVDAIIADFVAMRNSNVKIPQGTKFVEAVTSMVGYRHPFIDAAILPLVLNLEMELLNAAGHQPHKVYATLNRLRGYIRNPPRPTATETPKSKVKALSKVPSCKPIEFRDPFVPTTNLKLRSCSECGALKTRFETSRARAKELQATRERLKEQLQNAKKEIQRLEAEIQAARPTSREIARGTDLATGVTTVRERLSNGILRTTKIYPDGHQETTESGSADTAALDAKRRVLSSLKSQTELLQTRWQEANAAVLPELYRGDRLEAEFRACQEDCKKSVSPRREENGVRLFEVETIESFRQDATPLVSACKECDFETKLLNRNRVEVSKRGQRVRNLMQTFNRYMRESIELLKKKTCEREIDRVGINQETAFKSAAAKQAMLDQVCGILPPEKAEAWIQEFGQTTLRTRTLEDGSTFTQREYVKGNRNAKIVLTGPCDESPTHRAEVLRTQWLAARTTSEIYEAVQAFQEMKALLERSRAKLSACEAKACRESSFVEDHLDIIERPSDLPSIALRCQDCASDWTSVQRAALRAKNAQRRLHEAAVNELPELKAKAIELKEALVRARDWDDPTPEQDQARWILEDGYAETRGRIARLETEIIPKEANRIRSARLEWNQAQEVLETCHRKCDQEAERKSLGKDASKDRDHPDPRVQEFIDRIREKSKRTTSPIVDISIDPSAGSTLEGKVQVASEDRWAAVKKALGRLVAPYTRKDPTLFDRALSRDFLQDRAVLMQGVRNDFQRQTDINLELQLLTYRFTTDLAIVQVRWQRSAIHQSTGLVQVLQGNCTLFLDRFDSFRIKGLFGASFVGVTDAVWQRQAQAGSTSGTNAEVLFDGGEAPIVPTPPTTSGPGSGTQTRSSGAVRLEDAVFGTGNQPNHLALNLKTNQVRTFRRGVGADCAPGTCSQAGDDLILSPNFFSGTLQQGFGQFFALQGQGDGGPDPSAALFDCGFSSLAQQSGVQGNGASQIQAAAGPAPYTYVLGVRGTTGLFSLVEVRVTEVIGQMQGDVELTWTSPASSVPTSFGPGQGSPCGP